MDIYAVYDNGSKSYRYWFFAETRAVAIRMFTQSAVGDTEIAHHPLEFTLCRMADCNQAAGKIMPLNMPEQIATAVQCQREVRRQQQKVDDAQRELQLETTRDLAADLAPEETQ